MSALIFTTAFFAATLDKPEMPKGNWTREADGFTLRFAFEKDKLKITAMAGEATLTVNCKCEIANDGTITATVKDITAKGEFPALPKEGQTMKFQFKTDGKKAELSNFESADLDHAKPVIEGEYEQKSD